MLLDLNMAKGRKTLDIRLADKTFRILRVVTGVRQLYAEYANLTADILGKALKLQELKDSLGPDAVEQETDEYRRNVEAVSREVEEFVETKRDLFFRMVELILSKNGHDVDRIWWDENTDDIDRKEFLEACLNKDVPDQKKTTTDSDSTTKS